MTESSVETITSQAAKLSWLNSIVNLDAVPSSSDTSKCLLIDNIFVGSAFANFQCFFFFLLVFLRNCLISCLFENTRHQFYQPIYLFHVINKTLISTTPKYTICSLKVFS